MEFTLQFEILLTDITDCSGVQSWTVADKFADLITTLAAIETRCSLTLIYV